MDYNFSDRDQLRGRFAYNKYNYIDIAAQLPAFFQVLPQTSYLTTIAEYHTFSPTVTNEFRLGYNRFNQPILAGNFTFPGLNAFPNLTLDELGGLQLGPNPNAPQSTVQNLYQGADNLTWVKGNHTFKFGTDFRKSISPQTFTQRSRGDYEWSTLQDYLYDLPGRHGRTERRQPRLLRRSDLDLFVCPGPVETASELHAELWRAVRIHHGSIHDAAADDQLHRKRPRSARIYTAATAEE